MAAPPVLTTVHNGAMFKSFDGAWPPVTTSKVLV